MGIIRFLLAMCVVVAHSGTLFGFGLTGGVVAVECFFMISGFYIAYIWFEKYQNLKNSVFKFISNRFLRIYPLYWIILAITILFIVLIASLKSSPFWIFYYYNNLIEETTLLSSIIISNAVILGLDVSMFLGITAEGNIVLQNYSLLKPDSLPIHNLNFVPPAWTLSLEIYFYLLAPFILKRGIKFLAITFCISFFLKIFMGFQGYRIDYFEYGFFPFEMMFFCAGCIMYYIYIEVKKIKNAKIIGIYLATFLIMTILLYDRIDLDNTAKKVFIYSLLCIAIPFLFNLSKNISWDRFIGDLSYPIYISHWLTNYLLFQFFRTQKISNYYFGITSCLVAFVAAVILFYVVIKPIEKYRQNRILNE